MNKKKFFRPVLLALGVLVLQSGRAQVSTASNSPGIGDYVGCDGLTTFPLEVRHNGNQPIDWYTNAIQRMRLLPDATYAVGSGTPQVRDGSLLLCPDVDQFFANGAPGPYSLLQLAAATDNALQISNRDWMDIGITFTGNADHGYIGQKAGALDFTDMVIHWSDNPGEFLKDRLRFIFTSGSDPGALSGAQSEEGLEFMRFFPNRFEDPLVGIGDFYAANLADPTITIPRQGLSQRTLPYGTAFACCLYLKFSARGTKTIVQSLHSWHEDRKPS